MEAAYDSHTKNTPLNYFSDSLLPDAKYSDSLELQNLCSQRVTKLLNATVEPKCILDLPVELLLKIFEHLSCEEVEKNRLVCKRFNDVGQKHLHLGINFAANQFAKLDGSFDDSAWLYDQKDQSVMRNIILCSISSYHAYYELIQLLTTCSLYSSILKLYFVPGRILDKIFHIIFLAPENNCLVPLKNIPVILEILEAMSGMSGQGAKISTDSLIRNKIFLTYIKNEEKNCADDCTFICEAANRLTKVGNKSHATGGSIDSSELSAYKFVKFENSLYGVITIVQLPKRTKTKRNVKYIVD